MKQQLIMWAIKLLMGFLSPELLKKGKDYIVEKVEAYVEGTDNTVDDFFYNVLKGQVETLKALGDMILDFCEDFVLGTNSKVDDALVLPVCQMIRTALDIPDND